MSRDGRAEARLRRRRWRRRRRRRLRWRRIIPRRDVAVPALFPH